MASVTKPRTRSAQAALATSPGDQRALVGGWTLVEPVHQGSLTAVYRARPSTSDADGDAVDAAYALKLLQPDWENNPAAQALIQREAVIGRQAASPHLVSILAAHTQAAPYYVVMPWLEGVSLAQLVERRGALPAGLALWAARQTAEALDALHQCGWVHGDVKPANILLAHSGHATLVDLGFARRPGDLGTGLDRVAMGTPHYLAPECLCSQPRFDARSDLYALGVTLYELLCGMPASSSHDHDAEDGQQAAPRRCVDLRQRAPWVSRDLAKLVACLTANEPLRRPQSAHELVEELVSLEIDHLADRLPAA
ncbi:MAG: serine/threonine-protein kinase [Pirellulales bacterium]